MSLLRPKPKLLAFAFGTLVLSACGEKKPAEEPLPPPACAPGTVWNGQACVASTNTPPPTPTPDAGTQSIPPLIPTAAPGPQATPLDATAAAAATELLKPLAAQSAPGAKPIGSALAGQFMQGQSLEQVVQMQPGKCYTVVAAGLPAVANVDVLLIPMIALPGVPSVVVASDQTSAPTAVLAGHPNCFKWAAPVAGPMRLVLTVSQGQGMAAAQVYEK